MGGLPRVRTGVWTVVQWRPCLVLVPLLLLAAHVAAAAATEAAPLHSASAMQSAMAAPAGRRLQEQQGELSDADRASLRAAWRARAGQASQQPLTCLPPASPLRARTQFAQELRLEALNWSSQIATAALLEILLREAVGYVDTTVLGMPGGSLEAYERLASGTTHVNAEIWPQSASEQFEQHLGDGTVMDMGSVGYQGLSGWFISRRTMRENKDFRYFPYYASLQDETVMDILREPTWELLAGNPNILRTDPDDPSSPFVCASDEEREAAGLKPAGCVDGIYAPPQCQDGHRGGGPNFDGSGPCALLYAVDPSYDPGQLQQMARNLGMRVSIAWLSAERFQEIVRSRVLDDHADTLVYYWEPDPFISAMRCDMPSGAADGEDELVSENCWHRITLPQTSRDCHMGNNNMPSGTVDCDFFGQDLRILAWPGMSEVAITAEKLLREVQVEDSDIAEILVSMEDNGGIAHRAACDWILRHEATVLSWLPHPPECTSDNFDVVVDECLDSEWVDVTARWKDPPGCYGGVELPPPALKSCDYVPMSSVPGVVHLTTVVSSSCLLLVLLLLIARLRRTIVLRRTMPRLIMMSCLGALIYCVSSVMFVGENMVSEARCAYGRSLLLCSVAAWTWPLVMMSRRLGLQARHRIDVVSDNAYLAVAVLMVSATACIEVVAVSMAPSGVEVVWTTLANGVQVEQTVCSKSDADPLRSAGSLALSFLPLLISCARSFRYIRSRYNLHAVAAYVRATALASSLIVVGLVFVSLGGASDNAPVLMLWVSAISMVSMWVLVYRRLAVFTNPTVSSLAKFATTTPRSADAATPSVMFPEDSRAGDIASVPGRELGSAAGYDVARQTALASLGLANDIRTILHNTVLNFFLFRFLQRSVAQESLALWRELRALRAYIAGALTSRDPSLTITHPGAARGDGMEHRCRDGSVASSRDASGDGSAMGSPRNSVADARSEGPVRRRRPRRDDATRAWSRAKAEAKVMYARFVDPSGPESCNLPGGLRAEMARILELDPAHMIASPTSTVLSGRNEDVDAKSEASSADKARDLLCRLDMCLGEAQTEMEMLLQTNSLTTFLNSKEASQGDSISAQHYKELDTPLQEAVFHRILADSKFPSTAIVDAVQTHVNAAELQSHASQPSFKGAATPRSSPEMGTRSPRFHNRVAPLQPIQPSGRASSPQQSPAPASTVAISPFGM